MNPEGKQYKDECARVMDKLLVHSPFGVVTCDVHTYLYRRDGYKNMKIKPVELKSHYQQVNRLYQNIAYAFYKEESVSKLAVRICILITIFESETIPCGNVGATAGKVTIRESHDADVAARMATYMHIQVERGVKLLFDTVKGNVDQMIAEEHNKVGNPRQQRFEGASISSAVLELFKESLNFSLTYPTNIDKNKKTCTLRTAILYSPYEENASGHDDISPRLVGGFESTITIPFRGKTIRNPLYSPSLAGYWRKELSRVGLTSKAIAKVTGTAWDRDFRCSNMSLEAHLRNVKRQNSRYKESIQNLPSMFVSRWEQSEENGALMATQIRSHGPKMKRREAQAVLREEDMEPIWQRGTHATAGPLKDCWNKMMKVLDAAMVVEHGTEHAKKYQFSKSNAISMHRVLEYASNIFEGENLTQSQFYQWHRGERKKMLPKGFTLLIEEMHDKYIVRQQRYATGQRMSKVFFDEITGEQRSFSGTVIGFDVERELYEVRYDDGDGEELYEDDLSKLLTNGDIE